MVEDVSEHRGVPSIGRVLERIGEVAVIRVGPNARFAPVGELASHDRTGIAGPDHENVVPVADGLRLTSEVESGRAVGGTDLATANAHLGMNPRAMMIRWVSSTALFDLSLAAMSGRATHTGATESRSALPTVTIVLLVYNRRDELQLTLSEMLEGCDYDSDLIDVVVVDNASEDGSAEMVCAEFPQVRLIRRAVNCGVSGWNDGFAVAKGDLVLVLDDDCYLPGDRLRRAIASMEEHEADMVSFSVVAADDPEFRFDLDYRTGLLTFWGCAAMIRRSALEEVGGFDPEIFVWAHEVEFMIRFYDKGYRHLHLPEVTAVHMKDSKFGHVYYSSPNYRFNARNFGYIAAKHLRARDAFEVLVALLASNVRNAIRMPPAGFSVVRMTLAGFARGLRHREPLENRELSRAYRHNFYDFAGPWKLSRAPREWLRVRDPDSLPQGRVDEYFEQRARYYPTSAATLEFPPA